MTLPLDRPLLPQLARGRTTLPEGDEWIYERKWDGFRAIAFVDGDETTLSSRSGKPLERYFPEVALPPGRYVLDGELVRLADDGTEDFDGLGNRIHPAASRIAMLAESTPATFVAFDLLARDDEVLLERPLTERRAALEALVDELGGVRLGPDGFAPGTEAAGRQLLALAAASRDPEVARGWLQDTEGVVAKQADAPYRPGARAGMAKIKRVRTADCVVAGWRPGKEEGTVGSLILGLYEEDGTLRTVGHTSGLKAKEKRDLVDGLAPYATGERGSADPSRWANDRDLEWVALRPELVVEVRYDQVSAGRIRHGARLLRWRDDKAPRECTFDQLDG